MNSSKTTPPAGTAQEELNGDTTTVSMSVANVGPQPSLVSPAPALSQAQQDQAAKNRARGGVSGRTMGAAVVPGAVSTSGVANVEPQPSSSPSKVSSAPVLPQAQQDQAAKNRARGGVSGRTMGAAIVPGAVSTTPSRNITSMPQPQQDDHANQQARASRLMETPMQEPPQGMVSPLGGEFSKRNMTSAEQDILAKNRGRRPVVGGTTTVGATTHSAQAYQGGAPHVIPCVVSVSGVKAQEVDMTQAEQDVLAKNRGRRPVAGGITVGATTHSAQAYQGGAPPVVPGVVSVSGEKAQEGDERVRRKEERAERRENRRAGAPAATGGVIVGAHAYASSEPSVEQIKSQQGGVVHSAHTSNSNQASPANNNAANPLYTSSSAMSGEERQRRIDAKFAQVDREDAARADRTEGVHSNIPRTSHSNILTASKEFYPEEPATIQVRETAPIVLQPTTTADRGMAVAPDVEYGEIQQPLVEDQDLAVAIAIEDDEDDGKFAVAAVEYDPDAKPPIYKNRRFRVFTGVGCCILLVVIVIAIVSTTVLGGDEGDVIRLTNEPTSSPTISPTTSELGRYSAFFAEHVSELVFTPETSHELALRWIMNVDPLKLDIDSTRILQRYTMVLFYYSTSNNTLSPWRSCGPAVKGEDDSCIFMKYTREIDAETGDDPVIYVEQPNRTRWLSGADECEWEGILCEGSDLVLGIELLGQNLLGSLPTELATLSFLQQIAVPYNLMTGTIPEVYAGMKHLRALEVNGNMLTGTLPDVFFSAEGLSSVSSLRILNVGDNMLEGTISSDLGNLSALYSLHLFGNDFSGDFPPGLEKLTSLSSTRVNGNRFTGPIPSALGQLTRLTEVWFDQNRFTGTIPSEVGRLSKCTDFRISSNNITGPIPDEIFNMTRLTFLGLSDMDLNGTLSTRVAELVDLTQLRLSGNRLTGSVPSEVVKLGRLRLFWTHLNLFTGSMPENICNNKGPAGPLQVLQADCTLTDTGTPAFECLCCSSCCDRVSELCLKT